VVVPAPGRATARVAVYADSRSHAADMRSRADAIGSHMRADTHAKDVNTHAHLCAGGRGGQQRQRKDRRDQRFHNGLQYR